VIPLIAKGPTADRQALPWFTQAPFAKDSAKSAASSKNHGPHARTEQRDGAACFLFSTPNRRLQKR